MGVGAVGLDGLADRGVHRHALCDLRRELLELLGAGQLTVDEQPGNLDERAAVGELLDGVSAVTEHAGITVEERDRAAARRGVHERRVVGHQAEVIIRDLDVAKFRGTDRAIGDRDLVGLAGPVIRDAERAVLGLCRHSTPFLHRDFRGAMCPTGCRTRPGPRASLGNDGPRHPAERRVAATVAEGFCLRAGTWRYAA